MIRAIVFDLFDTLVDLHLEDIPKVEILGRTVRSTYPELHEALRAHVSVDFDTFARAMQQIDTGLRQERLRAGLEVPTQERFDALLERLDIPDRRISLELTEVHMARIRHQIRTVPHHPAVLDRLRARARLGVCSNFSHAATARSILQEAGLSDRLDAVVISEEVGMRKPRQEIFDAVLERLGVEAAETLHVGDRLEADVAGAAAAGLIPVWITRRVADASSALARHGGPAPAHVIRDLEELEPLLSAADA